ncbi:hypothetical protein PHISP_05626 [Aspergillus sp. HF37]|nr:hypothetical protein PHISP_05626 [Aspergillus sp. HF37]
MADIRSLLRNELASRKGGPQAGNTGRATKKRKVENMEDLTRKRVRSGDVTPDQPQRNAHNVQVQPPSAQATDQVEEGMEHAVETAGLKPPSEVEAEEEEEEEADANPPPPDTTKSQADASQAVNEDEWAAFEREVAAPTRVPHAPAALAAEATISAAPVSTEELAAQQQKESESARTRETEVEGEREDAARFMEDEFDEMEQLEERVRRLKEKREELRKKRSSDETEPTSEPVPDSRGPAGTHSDDDESDDDDDWDNWRFR